MADKLIGYRKLIFAAVYVVLLILDHKFGLFGEKGKEVLEWVAAGFMAANGAEHLSAIKAPEELPPRIAAARYRRAATQIIAPNEPPPTPGTP
jgi:hypothetical protein